jgi:hypothetical protein
MPEFNQVLNLARDANVRSSAYTYIALCEIRLANPAAGRRYLVMALSTDREYNNTLARTLAAGLYVAGRP